MNPKIKIEKNVPLPDKRQPSGLLYRTLLEMKKGDSILVDRQKEASWRSCAWTYGVKIYGRKASETECRLWKV
jgi:hypothetical protein